MFGKFIEYFFRIHILNPCEDFFRNDEHYIEKLTLPKLHLSKCFTSEIGSKRKRKEQKIALGGKKWVDLD